MKNKKWMVMIPVLVIIAVIACVFGGNTGKDYEDTIAMLTQGNPGGSGYCRCMGRWRG